MPAVRPLENVLDRAQVEQAQHLGLLDRALEASVLEHLAEVEQGAGEGGAWDAVLGGAVGLGERDACMCVDPGPGSR